MHKVVKFMVEITTWAISTGNVVYVNTCMYMSMYLKVFLYTSVMGHKVPFVRACLSCRTSLDIVIHVLHICFS